MSLVLAWFRGFALKPWFCGGRYPLLALCITGLRAEVEAIEPSMIGQRLGRDLVRTAAVILSRDWVVAGADFDYASFFTEAAVVFPNQRMTHLEHLVVAIVVGGHFSLAGMSTCIHPSAVFLYPSARFHAGDREADALIFLLR